MKELIVLTASRLFAGRSPMKITRRFAVATLLVIAMAIVLGAPAPASAGKGTLTSTFKLYPAADSPSPHATGTVTGYKSSRWDASYYAVGVSVSRLAPNASYYMAVTVYWYGPWWEGTPTGSYVVDVPIQTDARGNGEGGFSCGSNNGYSYYIGSLSFQVYDSSGTLVLTSNR
jgi:hypothetical protein